MRDTTYDVPTREYARVVTTHARNGDGTLGERPVPAALPANVSGDGGLYSTAADYSLFVRMLLNDGRLGSTRILDDTSVRSMFRNHTGSVTVRMQATDAGAISRPFPTGAGEDVWGLGFQLSRPEARKPDTRSPGSGTWAGIFNTHFWIDRQEEIGVVVMMQLLPFYDDRAMSVLGGVEQIVYQRLN